MAFRLKKELKDMNKLAPPGVTAGPVNDKNMYEWKGMIIGPSDTPYNGGIFALEIKFPKRYPFEAPKIRFTTPIYHCNIDSKGNICLDILKDQWSPALTIDKVLLSILALLQTPNPDDPLVPSIAQLYQNNRGQHDFNAREYTLEHASG
jgi:ubiquitin-conjugating enzyme E2 D/E